MSLPIPVAGDETGPEASGLIDPAQEVELWWGGYAGRTMLPAFLLCALLSAAVVVGAELLWQEESVPAALIFRLAMYLIVLVWAAALARWAYFTTTLAYRLTTRRLLRERGFAHPALPAIELARVRDVRVEQRAWERWVGVGRLLVEVEGGAIEVFHGLHQPARVAEVVWHQVRDCQGAGRQPPTSQSA
jgi:hypothetical protein